MQVTELTAYCLDFQAVAVNKGLEMDCMAMFNAFYEQDKMINGSNKKYIGDGESYQRFMQQRYDKVLCCINETIESKLQYDKLQRNAK